MDAKAAPSRQSTMNIPYIPYIPKPAPPDGDTVPFLPSRSATGTSAPTVAVVGDSVARDYAYYLARELGPRGVRVVDAAIPNCPASTLFLIEHVRGTHVFPRGGACPRFVTTKQDALVTDFSPQVILWHSIVEMYDIYEKGTTVAWGSGEWERRVTAEWDGSLTRLTRRGASVVVILPIWYQRLAAVPPGAPGPSIESLRGLYTRWASAHRDQVTLVDVAPLACPAGPPCKPVNGIDFRPDNVHFGDPGGARAAAYLRAQVPALARLPLRAATGTGA